MYCVKHKHVKYIPQIAYIALWYTTLSITTLNIGQ